MWKFAIIYSLALLVIAASVAEVKAGETVDETTDLDDDEAMGECGICRKEECPPASDCRAGLVLDRCGCCNVCGRIEGEKCDNYTLPLQYKDRYGFCGDNMACLLRNDMEDLVSIFLIRFRIHSNHPPQYGIVASALFWFQDIQKGSKYSGAITLPFTEVFLLIERSKPDLFIVSS